MQTPITVRPQPELTTAARRLLRVIVSEHEHRAFADNADCQRLIRDGHVEILHRRGDWCRLRVTPKGFAEAL